MKLWQGRFSTPLSADADAFNQSLTFDKKLYKADITASIAHATMLGECGIISAEDSNNIREGLAAILADIESGVLVIEGQEDIHSFVENELVSRIGDAGKRLHTARSRNDQVATDIRLYTRASARQMVTILKDLVARLPISRQRTSSTLCLAIHTLEKRNLSTARNTSTLTPRCSFATPTVSSMH